MLPFPLRPVPARYPITAEFGRQNKALWNDPKRGEDRYKHRGVDFGCPVGTPVRAIADCVGRAPGSTTGLGDYAEVQQGLEIVRCTHMSKVYVKAGQTIRRGDTIGLSGNSGKRADGKAMPAHLHLELLGPDGKFRNPEPFGPLLALDPGHGGSDGGFLGPGMVREADVVLFAAEQARAVLERAGFEVLLTRDPDSILHAIRTVSLAERVRLANEAKADVFLSLHCAGSDDPAARGITAYRLAGGQAERVAAHIHELAVVFTGANNKGTLRPPTRLAVLTSTKMPAVLFELGHITNPAEGVLLADPGYRKGWAHAITAGLLAWCG